MDSGNSVFWLVALWEIPKKVRFLAHGSNATYHVEAWDDPADDAVVSTRDVFLGMSDAFDEAARRVDEALARSEMAVQLVKHRTTVELQHAELQYARDALRHRKYQERFEVAANALAAGAAETTTDAPPPEADHDPRKAPRPRDTKHFPNGAIWTIQADDPGRGFLVEVSGGRRQGEYGVTREEWSRGGFALSGVGVTWRCGVSPVAETEAVTATTVRDTRTDPQTLDTVQAPNGVWTVRFRSTATVCVEHLETGNLAVWPLGHWRAMSEQAAQASEQAKLADMAARFTPTTTET